jgi:hypothetical protein
VLQGGNVGIGTTAPLGQLHVVSELDARAGIISSRAITSGNYYGASFRNTSTIGAGGNAFIEISGGTSAAPKNAQLYTNTDGDFQVYTGSTAYGTLGTARLTILDTGEVGIGVVPTNDSMLTIKNSNDGVYWLLKGINDNGNTNFIVTQDGSGSAAYWLYKNGSAVGSPDVQISSFGDSFFKYNLAVGGTALTAVGGGGALQINSANNYAALRLKSATADWGFFTTSDAGFIFRNTIGTAFTDPFYMQSGSPNYSLYITKIGAGFGTGSPTGIIEAYQQTAGLGTVTITGNTTCTGTGTSFLSTFKVGNTITITATGQTRAITAISSNTVMTIASATNTAGSAYTLAGGSIFVAKGNGNIELSTRANLFQPDNSRHWFGTGNDASIYYDGTYWQFLVNQNTNSILWNATKKNTDFKIYGETDVGFWFDATYQTIWTGYSNNIGSCQYGASFGYFNYLAGQASLSAGKGAYAKGYGNIAMGWNDQGDSTCLIAGDASSMGSIALGYATGGGGEILTWTLNSGGSGFNVNDTVYVVAGSSSSFNVDSVTSATGALISVSVAYGGVVEYQVGQTFTVQSGNYDGLIQVDGIAGQTYAVTGVAVNIGGSGYNVSDSATIQSGGYNAYITVDSIDGVSGAILSASTNNAGTGYSGGETLTIQSGSYNATIYVDSVGGSGEVTAWTLTAVGSSYTTYSNPVYTTGGGNNDFTVQIDSVSNGAVISVSISSAGSGYSVGTGISTSGGSGSGLYVDITSVEDTTGYLTAVSVSTAGTGYSVGSNYGLSSGSGQVNIVTVDNGGTILSMTMNAGGTNHSVGTGQALSGGYGSGATIDILTITPIGHHIAEKTGSFVGGQNVMALSYPNIIAFGKNFTAQAQNSFNVGFGALDFRIRKDPSTLKTIISAYNIPTSSSGLTTGDIWNNGGVLTMV